jgi:hypothetical protein
MTGEIIGTGIIGGSSGFSHSQLSPVARLQRPGSFLPPFFAQHHRRSIIAGLILKKRRPVRRSSSLASRGRKGTQSLNACG